MKKLLFLLMLCYAVGCTSSDEVDNFDPDNEEESTSGDTENEVETLNFADLILLDEYKDLTTEEQIELAIDQISEGGIIQFPAGDYALTTSFNITKSVTLQGVGVTPTHDEVKSSTTSLQEIAGASDDIETRFTLQDKKSIYVYADNVTFKHLIIEGQYQSNGVIGSVTFVGSVNNFQTENVYFDKGSYLISPRNSMVHGLKCRYTTFYKSKNRAFFINRMGDYDDVETIEKCEFYRCEFSVMDPADVSDTRAISIDAGNTENPNILDFDGLDIRECYFDDIGFASSKCKNFQIVDCEFYVKDLFDFPLHIEEYTSDALVKGCTFTCDNTTKVMMGVFDNSIIEDNVVVGSCGGFIQGQYAENMTVRNNDLTQMVGSSNYAISFWYAKAGSRDITIENNIMPAGSQIYICYTNGYEDTISVTGNSPATTTIKGVEYEWPLEDNGLYWIKHIEEKKYLTAQGENAYVTVTDTKDRTSLWRVTKVWPNRYNVKCEIYDTYLYIYEDTEGYSDDITARAANICPETKTFSSSVRLPIWEFTEQTDGGNIVGPGGGNHGCVSIDATDGGLKCLKESTNRGKFTVTNTESLWEFEKYE